MRGLVGVRAAATAVGVRLGVRDMAEFSSKSTMMWILASGETMTRR